MFHGLFRDAREINQNHVHPQQGVTVGHLRQIIQYFLCCGYQFVSTREILNGLNPGRKYAMLTFDDGYFNNSLAVPVLHEFDVPATFYVSTNHVRQGRCFWWDVVYRQGLKAGATACTSQELASLKVRQTADIEEVLRRRFGPQALMPLGDVDRPFRPEELEASPQPGSSLAITQRIMPF